MNESYFQPIDAKFAKEGLTFDDVLLLPAESEFPPSEADTKTYLTSNIQLNIPVSSSAMDTVTEAELAIALAREGGIGIVHRNLPIERQAEEIDKVKRSESGMIEHPITLTPDKTVADALEVTAFYRIGGVPIISEDGILVGMITNRDLKYEENYDTPVTKLMTPLNKLVTAPPGISLEDAKKVLHQIRKEKLPIVDDDYRLHGLITIKDIDKIRQYPTSCKDELGRLRVGAAVSPSSSLDEIGMLVEAKVDVLVIDTAHGHSKSVVRAVQTVKTEFPNVDLIVGNVVTGEATQRLIDAGADGIKVGIGPGSICTTRVIAGIGVPQITADGGIRYSGDIAKAIGAGASSVMIGSLFAGTEESPGKTIIYQGRKFKVYRGMGSLSAMRKRGGKERYAQGSEEDISKLVPEGIEGRVPYKGTLSESVYQFVGGLRTAMGYCGTPDIESLRLNSRFIRITGSGYQEGHPHDVVVTEEAPNYSIFGTLFVCHLLVFEV